MSKMKYTEPEIEIINFENEDIIVTSGFDLEEDKISGLNLYDGN